MDKRGRLLAETCKTFAAGPALDATDRVLTYRELSEAASAIERALLSVGLTPDEPLLVPVANEARDPAALMGVWRAGGVAVARGAPVPPKQRGTMRAGAGVQCFLTQRPQVSRPPLG